MSAGEFTNTGYQATYAAVIHPIRVQEETLEAVLDGVANAAPAGAINNPISARVGKSRRAFGLGARMVTLEFTGEPPEGYTGDPVRIPALSPAFFTKCVKGVTGTYLGANVKVVSNTPEDVK